MWTTHPASGSLNITIGRLVLAAVGLLLAVEAILRKPRVWRLSLPAALLASGLLWGLAVIGTNAAAHGTLRSQGSFPGYCEFVAIVLLVLALASGAPRFAFPLLLASAGGTLIGDVLALTGAQGGQFGGTSRLIGAYGNPNYFAFGTGLALVVVVGAMRFAPTRARLAMLFAIPVAGAVLVQTYSRSGAIGAFAGTLVMLALWASTLKARLMIISAATLIAVGVGVALYPAFQHARLKSDFASQIAGGLADRSGWDPSPQGFIDGTTHLGNPSPGVLQVNASRPAGGVSHPFGVARRGWFYKLSLGVKTSPPGVLVRVGMEDNYSGDGPRTKLIAPAPAWRRLSVTWRPIVNSSHARFYVWTTTVDSVLYLRHVTLTSSGSGRAPQRRVITTRLSGRLTVRQAFSGRESNFINGRLDADKLSLKLFRQHPLLGVGWEEYEGYAAHDLSTALNSGSTHDDYLRMLAELGIPGLLFLLICLSAVVVRLRRANLSSAATVAVGPLVAGAVELFFITALETPIISLTLAAALGILCANPPRVGSSTRLQPS